MRKAVIQSYWGGGGKPGVTVRTTTVVRARWVPHLHRVRAPLTGTSLVLIDMCEFHVYDGSPNMFTPPRVASSASPQFCERAHPFFMQPGLCYFKVTFHLETSNLIIKSPGISGSKEGISLSEEANKRRYGEAEPPLTGLTRKS